MENLHHDASDMSEPVATGRGLSRQAATDDEYISIKEALEIFISRGRPITERTLQRYCDKQHLDGQKRITAEGEKWFVRKSSVLRRIKELDEFDALRASRQAATSDDTSAPVAEVITKDFEDDKHRQAPTEDVSSSPAGQNASHPTGDELSRQAAAGRDNSMESETHAHTHGRGMSAGERELYERMVAPLEEVVSRRWWKFQEVA